MASNKQTPLHQTMFGGGTAQLPPTRVVDGATVKLTINGTMVYLSPDIRELLATAASIARSKGREIIVSDLCSRDHLI